MFQIKITLPLCLLIILTLPTTLLGQSGKIHARVDSAIVKVIITLEENGVISDIGVQSIICENCSIGLQDTLKRQALIIANKLDKRNLEPKKREGFNIQTRYIVPIKIMLK